MKTGFLNKFLRLNSKLFFMNPLLYCLVAGHLISAVAFPQTDTAQKENSYRIFTGKHFNNPFYNLPVAKPPVVKPFSFLRGSEMHVSSHSSYSFVPYSSYSENMPAWKEILSLAGKIAIQAYEDNHTLLHFYPNQ
jgi:hypothetical protein